MMTCNTCGIVGIINLQKTNTNTDEVQIKSDDDNKKKIYNFGNNTLITNIDKAKDELMKRYAKYL